MENSDKLLQLDSKDNVGVARQKIRVGDCISISGMEIQIKQEVKLGFKLALQQISIGDRIIKYGTPIGSANHEIHPGEVVHVHNMKSDFSPTYTIENQDTYEGQ